jgi:hypothetical protein
VPFLTLSKYSSETPNCRKAFSIYFIFLGPFAISLKHSIAAFLIREKLAALPSILDNSFYNFLPASEFISKPFIKSCNLLFKSSILELCVNASSKLVVNSCSFSIATEYFSIKLGKASAAKLSNLPQYWTIA